MLQTNSTLCCNFSYLTDEFTFNYCGQKFTTITLTIHCHSKEHISTWSRTTGQVTSYAADVSHKIISALTFILRFLPSFVTTFFCKVPIRLIPHNLPIALHTNHSPSDFIVFLFVFKISTLVLRVFMYSHIVAVKVNSAGSNNNNTPLPSKFQNPLNKYT